jgi:hypothetical protein
MIRESSEAELYLVRLIAIKFVKESGKEFRSLTTVLGFGRVPHVRWGEHGAPVQGRGLPVDTNDSKVNSQMALPHDR